MLDRILSPDTRVDAEQARQMQVVIEHDSPRAMPRYLPRPENSRAIPRSTRAVVSFWPRSRRSRGRWRRPLWGVERTLRGQPLLGAHDPNRTFGNPTRDVVRDGRTARCKGLARSSMQPHPLHPALPRPSTRCAWSSGRNHGALLRTYISNAPGARETAFSSSSFASAVRPSWPSAAADQR